jgi:hypothetical protein
MFIPAFVQRHLASELDERRLQIEMLVHSEKKQHDGAGEPHRGRFILESANFLPCARPVRQSVPAVMV